MTNQLLQHTIDYTLQAEIPVMNASEYMLMKRIIDLTISNNKLQKQVTVLHQELEIVQHSYAILQRAVFGKKSEKIKAKEDLNNSANSDIPNQKQLQQQSKNIVFSKKLGQGKKRGRKPLSPTLPRKQIIYDLPDSEKLCSCGCMLTKIGSDHSEQLDYIPASLIVIEHIRYKYACKSCEDTVRRAEVPNKPIAKSNATASLLAHILVSKFTDHLPLYRQSQIWQRFDYHIPRATLSNWVLTCGEMLGPLVHLLKNDLVKSDYLCSDETPVNVLSNNGKSYIWTHISGLRDNRAVLYEYHPGRSGKALQFLDNFQGYHQCDAYSAYNHLYKKHKVIRIGCWAHGRRKFYEITKLVSTPGVADRILTLIGLLYNLERQADEKKLIPAARKALRLKESVPILRDIKLILDEYKNIAPPKGLLGKAIAYCLNQWDELNAYLLDGRIRIDNNDCEGVIRLIALGRKNWLFYCTEKGARAGSNIYSIIQTAKANQLDIFNYLQYVLQNIKPTMTPDELRSLLPYASNKKNFLKQVV